jgi:hypothetical protein
MNIESFINQVKTLGMSLKFKPNFVVEVYMNDQVIGVYPSIEDFHQSFEEIVDYPSVITRTIKRTV